MKLSMQSYEAMGKHTRSLSGDHTYPAGYRGAGKENRILLIGLIDDSDASILQQHDTAKKKKE